MSHELRTPLNSSLILSKLLADNKDGNLTAEQVKFAQTITTAGNDLLALINDILDLSRIEAGKIDLSIEPVPVARIVDQLIKGVQPVAEQKKLKLETAIEPGAPEKIETDPQRIGQILKNLLSNALKFTERGRSRCACSPPATPPATAPSPSPCATPASASPSISARSSSRRSTRATAARIGNTAAPGSGCRSHATSRACSAATSRCRALGEGSVFTLTLPLVYTGPVAEPATASHAGSAASATAYQSQEPSATPTPSAASSAMSMPASGGGRCRGVHCERLG